MFWLISEVHFFESPDVVVFPISELSLIRTFKNVLCNDIREFSLVNRLSEIPMRPLAVFLVAPSNLMLVVFHDFELQLLVRTGDRYLFLNKLWVRLHQSFYLGVLESQLHIAALDRVVFSSHPPLFAPPLFFFFTDCFPCLILASSDSC